jgi:uncharacterized phage protein (TIGR02220 family)
MEQYFITLHSFSIEEYEVWKQLNKHCNYDTNITGYTVNQLVVNSDKRLNLTTQKVRTILKRFESKGYIKVISRGVKGKESTLKMTIKAQLFSDGNINKSDILKQSNDIKKNKKEDKKVKPLNDKYILIVSYLNEKANTSYRVSAKNTQRLINARIKEGFTVDDFKKVIDIKTDEWLETEFEKYLRPQTLFGIKFENYLNESNKKVSTKTNNQKNNSVNHNGDRYTRKVKML